MFNKLFVQQSFKHKRLVLAIAISLMALFTNACVSVPISLSTKPSSLDPHEPGAANIANLWWLMLAIGVVITLLVYALLMAAIMRRRRATNETVPDTNEKIGIGWLLRGGITLPLIVIAIVFIAFIAILSVVSAPQVQSAMTIKILHGAGGGRWIIQHMG